jgi:hypothetical protein
VRNESFFANPSFRRHLLAVTGGFTAALLALAAAAIFVPLFQRFDSGVAAPEDMLRLTGEILEIHARYWPVAALAWLSTLVCSWTLYARMRAPLVRFVAVYRALGAGRMPDDVVIRATDYLQDECAALNALLATLRARAEERAAAGQRIAELAAELGERAAASGDARLAALLDALEGELKALRDPGEGRA